MENNKPLIIFGRDIRTIPCFRDTFLYGISSGVAVGLATFMFTSKPSMSMHVGFSSYILVSVSYWAQCKYRQINDLFKSSQLQDSMEQSVILRGTEEIDQEYIDKRLKDA